MKKLIILVLLSNLLSTTVFSKESDGRKFWHGTGGQVVGLAAIYGLYYWLSDDEDSIETDQNQFSFYTKQADFQASSYGILTSASENQNNLYSKFRINSQDRITSYFMIGIDNSVLESDSQGFSMAKSHSYGLGASIELHEYSSLRLEYEEKTNSNVLETSNLVLSYSYSF